jgi:hypothetical protein
MTDRDTSHESPAAIFDLTEAELVARIRRRLPSTPPWKP